MLGTNKQVNNLLDRIERANKGEQFLGTVSINEEHAELKNLLNDYFANSFEYVETYEEAISDLISFDITEKFAKELFEGECNNMERHSALYEINFNNYTIELTYMYIIEKNWKETMSMFHDSIKIEVKDNFYRLHIMSIDDNSDADMMVENKFKPVLEKVFNLKLDLIKFAFDIEKPSMEQIAVNHNFDDDIDYYNTIDFNLNK